jgi:AcrR family transcriptional regulator
MPLENGRNLGGRPPRSSREAAVDTALDLLKNEGLAAVTLVAVAQRLGLGKVAMYTYVASKEDLLLAMRDEVNRRQLAALTLEQDLLPPAEALKAACLRLVDVLRDYGQLLAVVDPDFAGPGLQASERFLELLAQLGLGPAQQLQVWALIAGFLTTFATRGETTLSTGPEVEQTLAQEPGQFPRVAGLLHEAVPMTGPTFVEDVLTMVIDVLIPALRRS